MKADHVFVGKQVYPNGKSTSDHRTPYDFFKKIDEIYHFNLDAAASHENALCENYFTIADNSLIQNWKGSVWLNPPYNNIKEFVSKIKIELSKDMQKCALLVPNRTDTVWFKNAWKMAEIIYFIHGRLSFSGPNERGNGTAPFGSTLFIFDQKHYKRKEIMNISEFHKWQRPKNIFLVDREFRVIA